MNPTVQHERETVVGSAADRNDVGGIIPRSILTSTTNSSAGKNNQFGHLTPIERQFHNAHVIDDLADAGVARFHERGIRLNFYSFGNLTDCHHDVDFGIGTNLQDDSRLYKHPEHRKGGFQSIGS